MPHKCPRCNSEQRFARHTEDAGRNELGELVQVYSECQMCGYRYEFGIKLKEELSIEQDLGKLRAKERQGMPVSRVIERRQRRLREIQEA